MLVTGLVIYISETNYGTKAWHGCLLLFTHVELCFDVFQL